MANDNVYVWDEGHYDHARWLRISHRVEDMCMLHLTDLCHPGKVTSRGNVPCSLAALEDAVERGALQLTQPMGYVVLRRQDDLVEMEFKGRDDQQETSVNFKAQDLIDRIEAIKSQLFQSV